VVLTVSELVTISRYFIAFGSLLGFYALCNDKLFADVSTKRNAIFFIVKQSLEITMRFFETFVFFQMTRLSIQKDSNLYLCPRFCLVFCLWLEKESSKWKSGLEKVQ